MRAVARNWVEGRGGSEATDPGDPLTAAASAEIARRARQRGEADTLPEIAPDELSAVTLFLNLSTQWRHDALSGARSGIDYGVLGDVAGMLRLAPVGPELLADVRVMERAALDQLAARR